MYMEGNGPHTSASWNTAEGKLKTNEMKEQQHSSEIFILSSSAVRISVVFEALHLPEQLHPRSW